MTLRDHHLIRPVDPVEFTLAGRRRYKKSGRKRALPQAWQLSYIRHAQRLRRELTNAALARRLGVKPWIVAKYLGRGYLKG